MAKKTGKAKAKPKAKRSPSKPKTGSSGPDPKAQYLMVSDMEHGITMKVLGAYPGDKLELRPHPKSRTARELAWTFVMEEAMGETALTKGIDWSKPMPPPPPAPATMGEIQAALGQSHQKLADVVKRMTSAQLQETMKFPVAPRTMGDVPKIQFLWMLMSDQVHHRGQFSVYLRLADAKVPSIYGPSADEPWT